MTTEISACSGGWGKYGITSDDVAEYPQASRLFRLYDLNHDELLSYGELLNTFRSFDADGYYSYIIIQTQTVYKTNICLTCSDKEH